MFCSSGLSRLPNGRPYSIPTSRSTAASARIAARGRPSRTAPSARPAHAAARPRSGCARLCGRRATDEVGDARPCRRERRRPRPARARATSSRVVAGRSAIASLPAGTSGSRSRMRSSGSSSSSASRGESRKISGSIRSSESASDSSSWTSTTISSPSSCARRVELLEVLLVVVILDDDQARVGAGVAGGLGRGVDPEEDRQAGGVAHVGGGRLDGEPLGALLLGRPGRVRVGDERDDRDSVSLGDRLAEAAAACH